MNLATRTLNFIILMKNFKIIKDACMNIKKVRYSNDRKKKNFMNKLRMGNIDVLAKTPLPHK